MQSDKKRLPPAKKTLVSKSDLGRPLVTSPLEAIKNNALPMRKGCAAAGQNAVRQNVTQNAVRQNAFRYLRSRLPLPKASNSSRIRAQVSRIRAQVTQNRNRQKCRNVAYRTHSKERDKKRIPPAKKTLVSKSDLGRPLPKASNSSRIRAQVTQNQEKIASSKENLSLEI